MHCIASPPAHLLIRNYPNFAFEFNAFLNLIKLNRNSIFDTIKSARYLCFASALTIAAATAAFGLEMPNE